MQIILKAFEIPQEPPAQKSNIGRPALSPLPHWTLCGAALCEPGWKAWAGLFDFQND